MLKLNSLKLLVLLCLFASSCASVPNVPICAEISISKGACTYTVTGETVIVDDEHPLEGETWFDMRAKVLATPAKSWAKLKAYMIQMCKKYKCKTDISSWDRE